MPLDGGVFVSFGGDQETHFTACGDVFFADIAKDLAILDEGCGTDGSLVGKNREADDGGDTVAAGGDLHQGIFTQFEERRFAEEVERRSPAHGLLGENDQIGMLGLCFVNGIDDFRSIAVDVTDRVVQLGYGYFHGSNLSRKDPIAANLRIIWKSRKTFPC